MKNNINFYLVLLLTIAIYSCKKKDKNNEPAPTPVVEGTRALFNSYKTALCTGSVVYAYTGGNEAYLSSQDLSNDWLQPLGSTKPDLGSVSMNGVIFTHNYFGQNYHYYDPTSVPAHPTPQIWQISGSSNISAFTYTNYYGYPTFNGYTAVADSFQLSAGINIPLTNYSGADAIYVGIFKPSVGSITEPKFLDGSATSVAFTASELSGVGTCTNAYVVINFGKNNVQIKGGKKCNFRTTYSFQKSNVKLK